MRSKVVAEKFNPATELNPRVGYDPFDDPKNRRRRDSCKSPVSKGRCHQERCGRTERRMQEITAREDRRIWKHMAEFMANDTLELRFIEHVNDGAVEKYS